jgi:hypothetical protein
MNEKFKKLSEKFSDLSQNHQGIVPNKTSKLETKLEVLEENFNSSIEAFDSKFLTLKEHISKLKEVLETENNSKEEFKKSQVNDLKVLEERIKLDLNDEKEYMKTYIMNGFQKCETNLLKFSQATNKENDEIRRNLSSLKAHIEMDIPSIQDKIEKELFDREGVTKAIIDRMNEQFTKLSTQIDFEVKQNEESDIKLAEILSNISTKMKDEFAKEKSMREGFEEDVFRLLDETVSQLSELN